MSPTCSAAVIQRRTRRAGGCRSIDVDAGHGAIVGGQRQRLPAAVGGGPCRLAALTWTAAAAVVAGLLVFGGAVRPAGGFAVVRSEEDGLADVANPDGNSAATR